MSEIITSISIETVSNCFVSVLRAFSLAPFGDIFHQPQFTSHFTFGLFRVPYACLREVTTAFPPTPRQRPHQRPDAPTLSI
jgi:hypothetical protein